MTFLLSKECIELSRANCDPAGHPAASEVITVSSESEVCGHDHFFISKSCHSTLPGTARCSQTSVSWSPPSGPPAWLIRSCFVSAVPDPLVCLLYNILFAVSSMSFCVTYFLFYPFPSDIYILHPNLPYVKYQYYSFNHMFFVWKLAGQDCLRDCSGIVPGSFRDCSEIDFGCASPKILVH